MGWAAPYHNTEGTRQTCISPQEHIITFGRQLSVPQLPDPVVLREGARSDEGVSPVLPCRYQFSARRVAWKAAGLGPEGPWSGSREADFLCRPRWAGRASEAPRQLSDPQVRLGGWCLDLGISEPPWASPMEEGE